MSNVLPTDWERKKLGDVCQIIMGQSPPSSAYNSSQNGLPFFQGKSEFGKRHPIAVKWCTQPLKKAQKNDILMSVRAPVGPVNIADTESVIGRGLCAVRTNRGTDYLFVYHYLRSIEREIESCGSGSTFQAINKKQIESIEIPLPPLHVQKQIVAILEQAETLKERREKANEETQKIIMSSFYALIRKNNTLKSLGDFVIKTETRDPTQKPQDEFSYIDIAGIDNKKGIIVDVKKLTGKEAPSRARKVIHSGDVIVSTVRPNLNATALVPQEFDDEICSTGYSVLRTTPTLNNYYLYAFTRTKEFVEQLVSKAKGASYPAVTNNDVLDVKIPLPPISLQNQFAETVKKIESLKGRQKRSTRDINQLFDALMQKAFSGGLAS